MPRHTGGILRRNEMNHPRPDPVPFEDPRHERFAVLVVEGWTLAEAYREAMGRRISKSGADQGGRRLMQRDDVSTYIAAKYDYKTAQAARRERVNGLPPIEWAKRNLWK